MINPSKIVGFKKRIIIWSFVRIVKLKPDTFVYMCRDLDIKVGEIAFLLEYYFSIEPSRAKRIAFSSTAWGSHTSELVRHSDAAFDHFSEKKNRIG
jgi:hypothetical protein